MQQVDDKIQDSPAQTSDVKQNSLRMDVGWTMVGNVVYRGCQWGMLMAMAKSTSASDVGTFVLGLAIVAPIIAFAELQLRGVQASDAQDKHSFGEYIGLRLISLIFVLVISTMIAFLFYREWAVIAVIILTAVSKCIESTSDIVYGRFQKNMRMDKMGRSFIYKGLLSLILVVAVVWLTHSVVWALAVMAVSWLVILFCYDLPQAATFGQIAPHFNKHSLWILAKTAAPLGFVMALVSFQSSVPRYFVERYLGKAELGYFGAVSYVVVAGSTFVMALGQSAVPRFAKYYVTDRKAFKVLFVKMLAIVLAMGISMVILGTVFGKWFLRIVYTEEYAQNHIVFIWLLVTCTVTFVNSIFGYAVTASREFKMQVPQMMIVIVATTMGSWVLIPRFGLNGAAWAMLAGMLTGIGGWIFILRMCLKKEVGS